MTSVDELLALVVAAVAADPLHPCAGDSDVEDARVGGVRQVQAHDFSLLCAQRQVGFSVEEQDVAEAAHGDVVRLGRLKGAMRPSSIRMSSSTSASSRWTGGQ